MGRRSSRIRFMEPSSHESGQVVEVLRPLATPLATNADLDPLMQRIGSARYVLLGESTHGTSEFYEWRAKITRRLIVEKGFSLIAVEGDWPDFERVNGFVKAAPWAAHSARQVLEAFDRWPTWMWANDEVGRLCEWLREHNRARPVERRVGFYGLDVYSLWESMREVVQYLEEMDPPAAAAARRAYECFSPYGQDVQRYARATVLVPATCEREVLAALVALRNKAPEFVGFDREAYFHAEQNALVARNAEHYYRTMVKGGAASWNVRDWHMLETLERLMAFHGPDAKCVVWAHNTHVGDARHCEMADDGEINLGQLVRERHEAEGVVIVGCATHRGTVVAGDEWGAPMEIMHVPPARPDSVEDVVHRATSGDALLLFSPTSPAPLTTPRGNRAIGVVYHAPFERFGNYVPTVLPKRYDALLWVDESHALSPLHLLVRRSPEPPETFPSGV